MSDLDRAVQALLEASERRRPPTRNVLTRASVLRSRRRRRIFGTLALAVAVLPGIRIVETTRTRLVEVRNASTAPPTAGSPGPSVAAARSPAVSTSPAPTASGQTSAAALGHCDVAPDAPPEVGVTSKEVRLGAFMTQDGPAASLLQPAIIGLRAVIDRVNAAGGVCGRRLSVTLRNDSFEVQRRAEFANEMSDRMFAFVATSPPYGSVPRDVPFVGAPGLRIEEYSEPWTWPVGTATASTMRIMASHGYEVRNAHTFGVVYDSKYKFGIEGKDAFVAQVRKMGGQVRAEVPLNPEDPSYGPQDQDFKQPGKCGTNADKKCDMIALLLLPDTAKKWFQLQPVVGRLYTAGAQTLFSDKFAQDCFRVGKDLCLNLAIWTSYTAPIGEAKSLPGIRRYLDDVSGISPSADPINTFMEGAYFGTTLFVDALRAVGGNLTRERLRAHLDALDYPSDFATTLRFRPGRHFGNVAARSYAIALDPVPSWRAESDWVFDPAFR